MPVISRFMGVIIKMFYKDHPPKHFHAEYNEYKALISIENPRLVEGNLPPRVLKYVLEWAEINQNNLLANWALAQKQEPLENIEGLE